MEQNDKTLWSKIISPALRQEVLHELGVTIGVSPPFVEDVPLEDCGDFVWALVCISRWVPTEPLPSFQVDRNELDEREADALVRGALASRAFFDCPTGGLAKLLQRLDRNAHEAAPGPVRDAHEAAHHRILEIILHLAEQHTDAEVWLMAYKAPPQRGAKARRPRPTHLRIVRDER
jgi:hypothetical protein